MARKKGNSKPKNYIFSRGAERERLLREEREAEERKAKRSAAAKKGSARGKATKEFNQLKKAIEAHKNAGRTFYEPMESAPSALSEILAESERMKEELSILGTESRLEAKAAPTETERKRLSIKARLDETWGTERDRLKKILSELHKKDKDSRVEDDYNAFWYEDDTAEDEEDEEEERIPIEELSDDELPF